MVAFLRTFRYELAKILLSKASYITIGIVTLVQPFFAFIAAQSYLSIGLNATPETNANLVEALPPLEYIGFEVVLFGVLPMVVFGGLVGSSEFINHSLRTTFLCQSNRKTVFTAKVLAILVVATGISVITNYLTILVTHVALGDQGLNPVNLSPITWQYIGYTVLFWVFITLISFCMGLSFRNALIPLFFLVPQVYNLGNYLAQKWTWGKFLPVAAGNMMISTPTGPLPHEPLMGGVIMLIWMGVFLIIAGQTFLRKDVGGVF